MNLTTIQMDKQKAKDAFLEYREEVKRRQDDELVAIMKGFKALSQGHKLIELTKTLQAGGTMLHRWQPNWQRTSVINVLPRLAVCPADARFCWTGGVTTQGAIEFWATQRPTQRSRNRVRFPDGTFPEHTERHAASSTQFRATVPIVPPALRPRGNLSRYHILWEAEWSRVAPVDPALLRHIGGDLYAVLAVWDLTEVERAVLGLREV